MTTYDNSGNIRIMICKWYQASSEKKLQTKSPASSKTWILYGYVYNIFFSGVCGQEIPAYAINIRVVSHNAVMMSYEVTIYVRIVVLRCFSVSLTNRNILWTTRTCLNRQFSNRFVTPDIHSLPVIIYSIFCQCRWCLISFLCVTVPDSINLCTSLLRWHLEISWLMRYHPIRNCWKHESSEYLFLHSLQCSTSKMRHQNKCILLLWTALSWKQQFVQ